MQSNAHQDALYELAHLWDEISVLNELSNLFPHRNSKQPKKKWLVSTLANIFISKTSKNDEGGFKEGSGDVNRNQTKSFFNYLWLNLKDGMLKTVTALD